MTFLMDRAHAMLECRNKNLETPLLLACRKGHLNALKLLRERGARADAMDKYVLHSVSITGASLDGTQTQSSEGVPDLDVTRHSRSV